MLTNIGQAVTSDEGEVVSPFKDYKVAGDKVQAPRAELLSIVEL